MSIDPAIWPKLHGASTHFPVALAMAAALFDGASLIVPAIRSSGMPVQALPHSASAPALLSVIAAPPIPWRTRLRSAGYFSIILGALGTFPAVLSGLVMTKGNTMGHDALLFHHLFVWPSFALLVGLGVWRAIVGDQPSSRSFTIYFTILILTAALMAGAGYWGGELILNS